ncbi:MAG: H-type lectin domain-containing protein [Gemmobacter sp.]|nr:H-type lectin domain-containing protein [Gemmobacter sp.]
MKRIRHNAVGIVQGSRVLFSDFADDGPMWTGSGPRESRHIIEFQSAFTAAPAVMVGISMWDLDGETNTRADISSTKITATGFELVFKTWGDTRIARIRADWTAIGPVPDEDAWDLY